MSYKVIILSPVQDSCQLTGTLGVQWALNINFN